jgi:protein-tyrosine phosphatase
MTQRHVGRMIQMAPPGDVGEMKLFMDFVAGHEGEDVPDPWYGVQEGFELTLNMIELGVDRLVKDLKD